MSFIFSLYYMKVLKSIGAVLAWFILIFALTPVTDILVQKAGFMTLEPVDANPRRVFVVVILYRCIYYAAWGYLTARLAPSKPMGHALIVWVIVFILTGIWTIMYWGVWPARYPVLVTLTSIPAVYLGAKCKVTK